MTWNEFHLAMDDFVNLLDDDEGYFGLVSWALTGGSGLHDPFSGLIYLQSLNGMEWEVPVVESLEYGELFIGTTATEAAAGGLMALDQAGLYCYLWHQAMGRIVEPAA